MNCLTKRHRSLITWQSFVVSEHVRVLTIVRVWYIINIAASHMQLSVVELATWETFIWRVATVADGFAGDRLDICGLTQKTSAIEQRCGLEDLNIITMEATYHILQQDSKEPAILQL